MFDYVWQRETGMGGVLDGAQIDSWWGHRKEERERQDALGAAVSASVDAAAAQQEAIGINHVASAHPLQLSPSSTSLSSQYASTVLHFFAAMRHCLTIPTTPSSCCYTWLCVIPVSSRR